jgi:hypothetical protein
MDARHRTKFQVFHTKLGGFLNPGSGVVEKQQQGPVTQGRITAGREGTKERFDLVASQKACFRRGRSFGWNGCDACGFFESFRQTLCEYSKNVRSAANR